MDIQQLNEEQHPPHPLENHVRQVELELWSRKVGVERALSGKWQMAASGTLTQHLSSLYVEKVLEIRAKSSKQPGRQAHIWDLMGDRASVLQVALEALSFVLCVARDGDAYNKIAASIGRRAEHALWLSSPTMRNSRHLEGLRLASNGDLSMSLIVKRLRDKGFRKAHNYQPLKNVEKIALGAFFIECIQESTKLVTVHSFFFRGKRVKEIRFTDLYWGYLRRWKEMAELFRTTNMPMVCEPKPWIGYDNGGYLTVQGCVSSVDWTRWPEVSKHANNCVLGSINNLMEQRMRVDPIQSALIRACWNLGHEIGSLPAQTRLDEPVDQWYKEQGLGPTAYWTAYWEWKRDRRKDGARSTYINCAIATERLADSEHIWFVWWMDHRGRVYSRSSQLNVQGPDHIRSQLQFAERSPIKGHEEAFAWSLGDALGISQNPEVRTAYLESMSDAIADVGNYPLETIGLWSGAKEPWRFVQLCSDWAGYRNDPGYTSGTIHWLDQTCSGWGHVACLTRDATLASYTNVIGSQPADLYSAIGELIVREVKAVAETTATGLEGKEERRVRCCKWWMEHKLERSTFKMVLMPYIYGRTQLSLADDLKVYLRDEVGNFLTKENIRITDLALTLASIAYGVVHQALPEVRNLARWLKEMSSAQIDADSRPHWYTPNGLAVESYKHVTSTDRIKLALSNRTITIAARESTGKIDKRKTARSLAPDYIHSLDAAFLQRFVCHWSSFDHPLTTVHDCFGTTLENVGTMRKELGDQWHRFYSVDYLGKHYRMVKEQTEGRIRGSLPPPPMVGTLDLGAIGENPFLFC